MLNRRWFPGKRGTVACSFLHYLSFYTESFVLLIKINNGMAFVANLL